MKVSCDNCGETTEKKPSKVKRNNHNFCSKECWNEWHSNTVTIKCVNCGKKIERRKSKVKDVERSFCSPKCHDEWREEKTVTECANCGKKVKQLESRVEKSENTFCCQDCYFEYTANNVEITRKLRNFLEGHLLGDGCITKENKKSAQFKLGDKHEEYVNYVKSRLKAMNVESKIWKRDGYYFLESKVYKEMYDIREEWYKGNEKEIPSTFELTPTHLLFWHIGDGHKHKIHGYLKITVHDLRKGLEKIKSHLKKKCIKASINKHGLHIHKESLSNFSKYISKSFFDIPNCYSYKFPKKKIKN